ncbi:MAG: hypothetical protein LBG88_00200 [Christensenellaceae bacterium]|nr:hypothetical protein [Christensenellaceae bacterium]
MLEKFEQTPEAINESVKTVEKIRTACYDADPEKRLKNYMRALDEKVEYDQSAVDNFHGAKKQNDTDFRYEDYFNVAKFFTKKTGACQQFAVGLGMLCYGDPEIKCHQTVVKLKPKNKDDSRMNWYKHSVNCIEIPSKNIKGFVDVTNRHMYHDKVYSTQEYSKVFESAPIPHTAKFEGMAYYQPGLELKNIFKIMQSFGEGIKFDFESFEKGEKSFKDCFNQKRLSAFIEYQNNANKANEAEQMLSN